MYKANMTERRLGVKDFYYTDDLLDELEASLSRERLGTYLDAAGGDREGAIRLHAWNTAVSAAFYGPLQGLEVTLRNAMYRGLAEHYGEAWYDNRDAGLDRGAMERIASARTELARDGHGDDAPRIVAALSFGFWVSLLGPGGRIGAGRKANYEMTLWRPALRGAFAHRASLTRKEAHRPLNAESGPSRSPNPAQADHPFRFKPITDSGRTRSAIPVPSRSLFGGDRNRSGRPL